jgi:hypothetical protein
MCPTFPRSVRPPFATIELLQEVAVVSLTGLTCRRNCEFEVLKMNRSRFKNKGCQPAFRVGPTVGPLSISDRSKRY